MKAIYLPLICLLLLSCGEGKRNEQAKDTAQGSVVDTPGIAEAKPADTVSADTSKPSDPIAAIRQKVESINTSSTQKQHFEFMCDEKMLVDYLYRDNEIVKISVDYGTVGDVYAKEDYYYDAGKLIFMYEFVEGGPACEGCIKKNEYRSYIQNNSVIKYLKDKTVTKCRKCEFPESSKQYKLLTAKTAEEMKAILCR